MGPKYYPAQMKLHYADTQEIADLFCRMNNPPEERNFQEKW